MSVSIRCLNIMMYLELGSSDINSLCGVHRGKDLSKRHMHSMI